MTFYLKHDPVQFNFVVFPQKLPVMLATMMKSNRPLGPEGHLTDFLYLRMYFSSLRKPFTLNNSSQAINTSNFNSLHEKSFLFIHSFIQALSDEVLSFHGA